MKISLITVGRTDVAWVREGMQVYVSRLGHYCSFALEEIPELKNVSALSHDQIKQKEGELILKKIRNSDCLILLDERGKLQTSLEWASWIQGRLSAGRDLVFVIGGAYGFSKDVYDRAEGMVSLSKMTFSHQMVRAIFLEQLYRSFPILRGEPYHHE